MFFRNNMTNRRKKPVRFLKEFHFWKKTTEERLKLLMVIEKHWLERKHL